MKYRFSDFDIEDQAALISCVNTNMRYFNVGIGSEAVKKAPLLMGAAYSAERFNPLLCESEHSTVVESASIAGLEESAMKCKLFADELIAFKKEQQALR